MDYLSGSGSGNSSDCFPPLCPDPTSSPTVSSNAPLITAVAVSLGVAIILLCTVVSVVLSLLLHRKYCRSNPTSIKRRSRYESTRSRSDKESVDNGAITAPTSAAQAAAAINPDLQATLLLPRESSKRMPVISAKRSDVRLSGKDMASLPVEERLRALEFPHSKICLLSELGQTNIGKMYRGEALKLLSADNTTAILIKSLREEADVSLREAFDEEMRLASGLNHPNILSLLAVSTIEEPRYLIYEWMEFGSLKEFLQSTASVWLDMEVESTMTDLNASETTTSLHHQPLVGTDEMVAITVQVASAMEYLDKRGIVHKDLATRNCQVGEGLTIKISNFGFTYDLNCSDYSQQETTDGTAVTGLPLRWLAPEILQGSTHTGHSDVWAYGVLVWEVFSFGAEPYPGLTADQEVKDYVCSYHILSQPEYCPSKIYRIIRKCWDPLPGNRPSFMELKRAMRASMGGDLESVSRRFSTMIPSTPNLLRKTSETVNFY